VEILNSFCMTMSEKLLRKVSIYCLISFNNKLDCMEEISQLGPTRTEGYKKKKKKKKKSAN
jgi:hypothetical protein